ATLRPSIEGTRWPTERARRRASSRDRTPSDRRGPPRGSRSGSQLGSADATAEEDSSRPMRTPPRAAAQTAEPTPTETTLGRAYGTLPQVRQALRGRARQHQGDLGR